MKSITIPKHDFFHISEYDSLNMLDHSAESFPTLGAARAELSRLKAKGYEVAQDQYCTGLFITKHHYNGRESYLLSTIY